MIHVRQYRRLGTNEFKCQYVRDLLNCGGCQDSGNPLEAQAYAFQDSVTARLNAYLRKGVWHP
jgi:hypothetical protein